jgi:hypothetical protein
MLPGLITTITLSPKLESIQNASQYNDTRWSTTNIAVSDTFPLFPVTSYLTAAAQLLPDHCRAPEDLRWHGTSSTMRWTSVSNYVAVNRISHVIRSYGQLGSDYIIVSGWSPYNWWWYCNWISVKATHVLKPSVIEIIKSMREENYAKTHNTMG